MQSSEPCTNRLSESTVGRQEQKTGTAQPLYKSVRIKALFSAALFAKRALCSFRPLFSRKERSALFGRSFREKSAPLFSAALFVKAENEKYDSVSTSGQLEMAVENLEGFGKPRTDRQKSSKTAVGCETGSGRKTVISGIHSKLPHVPVVVE